jgi:glutathione S-transferase
MLKLYYAPRTRAVRVRWLLEELGLPHDLARVEFRPGGCVFAQETPLGKFPVLEDADLVMGESGAILEYLLERYDTQHRLAPPVGSPLRGPFLQWLHFGEATAFPPLGVIVSHVLYRRDADQVPLAIEAARTRATGNFDFVEGHLLGREFLVGEGFTAADIVLGFTLMAARVLGVLDGRHPRLGDYLGRLSSRPAFARATAD